MNSQLYRTWIVKLLNNKKNYKVKLINRFKVDVLVFIFKQLLQLSIPFCGAKYLNYFVSSQSVLARQIYKLKHFVSILTFHVIVQM